MAVNDVLDKNCPYQEEVLSDKKLNLLYGETRLLLGYVPNSRTMQVDILLCQYEKIMQHVEAEEWVKTCKSSTLRELTRIVGLLLSVCNIYPWGQAQLLIVQQFKLQYLGINLNFIFVGVPNEDNYYKRHQSSNTADI